MVGERVITATPASPGPGDLRIESMRKFLPRGAMLFTSGLLPVFAEMKEWPYFYLVLLIDIGSLAAFTCSHRREIFENIPFSVALIAFTIMLYFPFPGISAEFIMHRIPMFLILSSIIAVEISRFRPGLSDLNQTSVGGLINEDHHSSTGLGGQRSHGSRSPGSYSDQMSESAPDQTTIGLRDYLMKTTGITNHMHGPASLPSHSEHSSDITLSDLRSTSARSSWGPETRAWFPNTRAKAFQLKNDDQDGCASAPCA